jgi:hypothetical protein
VYPPLLRLTLHTVKRSVVMVPSPSKEFLHTWMVVVVVQQQQQRG